MRKHSITIIALLGCLIFGGVILYCIASGPAHSSASTSQPQPALPNGALRVRITFRDETVHNVILFAQSSWVDSQPSPKMRFHTTMGDVEIMTNNLLSITDFHYDQSADKCSALFTFRKGEARRLRFGGFTENIVIENEDGMREVIKLLKVHSLEIIDK